MCVCVCGEEKEKKSDKLILEGYFDINIFPFKTMYE